MIPEFLTSLLTALWRIAPFAKKFDQKKLAGQDPIINLEKDRIDELLTDALKQLGAGLDEDSLWQQISNKLQEVYVKPVLFKTDFITEWLSGDNVKKSLKTLAYYHLTKNQKLETQSWRSYFKRCGENEWDHLTKTFNQFAPKTLQATPERYLITTLSYLVTSVEVNQKSPTDTALILRSVNKVSNQIEGLRPSKEDVSIKDALKTFQYVDKKCEEELAEIISSRVKLGKEVVDKLRELIKKIEKNEFIAVTDGVKILVYDTIVRYAAVYNEKTYIEHALQKITELDAELTLITKAWYLVFKSDIDGAIKLLAKEKSVEAISCHFEILFQKQSKENALAFLDQLDLTNAATFTDFSWINVTACLLQANRIDDAKKSLNALSGDIKKRVPHLFYQEGLVVVTEMVPQEMKKYVLIGDFVTVTKHTLQGDDIDLLREKAYSSFQICAEEAKRLEYGSLCENANGWLRWFKLLDNSIEEREALKKDLLNESLAISNLPFALAFEIPFDQSVITKIFEQNDALGSPDDSALHAQIMLFFYSKRYKEILDLCAAANKQLIKIFPEGQLEGIGIEALFMTGDFLAAEKKLNESKHLLSQTDINAFELMLKEKKGEDPTVHAQEVFNKNNGLVELINLISALINQDRWQDAEPYILQRFEREKNIKNAKLYIECLERNRTDHEKISEFLKKNIDIVKQDDVLMSAYAWSLYYCGELGASEEINNTLLAKHSDENNLALDANLTVCSGDWDRLPAVLDKAWEKRHTLSAKLLFYFAKLNVTKNAERALQLLKEITEKHSDDPNILLAAYNLAIQLGHDELGFPFLHKAQNLSNNETGPVKTYSFKDLVDTLTKNGNQQQKQLEIYRKGEAPLHVFSQVTNSPLSHYYLRIPLFNLDLEDARKKQFIHIRSSATPLLDISQKIEIKSIALDITSVMILAKLGVFKNLLDAMDCVYLSARFMQQLWAEEEQLRYHQPSMVEEAKKLIRYKDGCRFDCSTVPTPTQLTNEVGQEVATLLQAAKNESGVFIHTGTLYKAGSYMDKEACIDGYEDYLAEPIAVIQTLHEQGQITPLQKDTAIAKLKKINLCSEKIKTINLTSPIYLDQLSAKYLENAGILQKLVQSRKVFISSEAFSEWQSLIDWEKKSQETIDTLECTRLIIKDALKSEKIKLLKETNIDKEGVQRGIHILPMVDIATVSNTKIDAICIDDKYVSEKFSTTYLEQREQYFLCSIDIINYLCSIEAIAPAVRDELLYQLRTSGFIAVPFSLEEVEKYLLSTHLTEDDEVKETAELKHVREYVCSLQASEFLQTNNDLIYWQHLYDISVYLIKKLWLDNQIGLNVVVARSSWIVNYLLPDLETVSRFSPNYSNLVSDAYVSWLSKLLYMLGVHNERYDACKKWLDDTFLSNMLSACSVEIDKLAEQLSQKFIKDIGSFSDEYEGKNSKSLNR